MFTVYYFTNWYKEMYKTGNCLALRNESKVIIYTSLGMYIAIGRYFTYIRLTRSNMKARAQFVVLSNVT